MKNNSTYYGRAPQKGNRPINRSPNQLRVDSNAASLLARLLYSEAAGDSRHGAGKSILHAIVWVIKNRVAGSTHPNTYLSVIYQTGKTGKPHFRGLPGGDNATNWNQFPRIDDSWNRYYTEAKENVILAANEVLSGRVPDPTFGSEWFRFRNNHVVDPTKFIEKKIKSGNFHLRLTIKNKNPKKPGSWIFVSK